MKRMHLRSYAKINLCLDVTGVREDGYHLVDTIMQKISLYDDMEFSWKESKEPTGFKVEIETNRKYLPVDSKNLAYKAAVLMNEIAGGKNGTISIKITKHIPVAAGLAGGSGNAACTIIALNRLWKLNYRTKELCEFGAKLGADVAFCVLTQNTRYTCALGTGVGDILTPYDSSLGKYLVLAKPDFGVSTKEVYENIDHIEIPEHPSIEALTQALKDKDTPKIYSEMVNVLECYTLERYEEVAKLKDIISDTKNVEYVLMSGSGPTVVGFYANSLDSKKACEALRAMGYEAYWAACEQKGRKQEKNND